MKCFKTLLLITFSSLFFFSSCKKENRTPPFGAAGLNPGWAAIKFTTSKAINGSRLSLTFDDGTNISDGQFAGKF